MTIYQSNLVVFDQIKNALGFACREECSGVFLIATENGEGAGFSLDHGKIVEAAYKRTRGNKALPDIKNISKARYFFEQGQSQLPAVSGTVHDLPDTTSILAYLGINKPEEAAVANETPTSIGKVMIVDDSRMVRSVVNKVLSKRNYEVIQVETGEQAMPAIEQERPQLVLLDIVLPGIDGNEVLRQIRASEYGKHLPVIILTSSDSLIETGSAENDRLTKPFKPAELLLKLDDYFQSDQEIAA